MDTVVTPVARDEIENVQQQALRLARGNNSADMAQIYALSAVTKAILYFADIYEKHNNG